MDIDVLKSHDEEGKHSDGSAYFTDLVSDLLKFLLKGGLLVFHVKFLSRHTSSGVDTNSCHDS